MELLEFARGEGLRIAVAVFAAGLVWRLLHLYLTMRKVDISEARQGGEKMGGLRTIFSRFRHHEPFRLSLIHISEPTRLNSTSRMPSSA